MSDNINNYGPFKPHRGKRSTAITKEILLQEGEIYFEVPESGIATDSGKIVMGDGVTPYEDLPYFTSGTDQVNSDWDATTGVAVILNKPIVKNTFTGTGEEWNNLSSEEKLQYEVVNITDDIGTDIDLSNYVEKSDTVGLIKNDGTIDTTTSTSISGNPISISGLKSNQLAVNPIITLEPIQDLHGQSKPYPAGGGKNIAPITVDNIKEANTSGTWSGNIYDSGYGCTFTIITDDGNNVVGIKVNGTATTNINFLLTSSNTTLSSGTYCVSGCPAGGNGTTTYSLRLYHTDVSTYIDDYGSGITFTSDLLVNVRIIIRNGYTASNLMFYPMVESGSSKTSYAPYENICPISGYNKIEVLSYTKNLFPEDDLVNVRYVVNGEKEPLGNAIGTNGFILVKPNITYYCSISSSSRDSNCRIFWYDKSFNAISYDTPNTSNKTCTSPANAKYATIYWEQTDDPAQYANDFLFCEDSITDKSYVPYDKIDLSESLGQTVYGATWYPRTGKLTVDRAIVDLGDLTWNKQSYGFIAGIPTMLSGRNATEYADNPMVTCSMFATAESLMAEIQNTIRPTYNGSTALSTATIVVFNTSYSDATTFKTAVTGQALVYPLATPFTIQLTPHEISLLKDYAYVSTNGTNIALDYHNGEMASLADVSQLGETVNEGLDCLKDYVGKNNMGTSVDLSSYYDTYHQYVFPTDGYINVASGSSATSGFIRIAVRSGDNKNIASIYMNVTGVYQQQSLFVRKGMMCFVQANTVTGSSASFNPLV